MNRDDQYHFEFFPGQQPTGITDGIIAPPATQPLQPFAQSGPARTIQLLIHALIRTPSAAVLIDSQHSESKVAPLLSLNSIRPASQVTMPLSSQVTMPLSSLLHGPSPPLFTFYDPSSEKKERSKRSCISCFNRTDRRVRITGKLLPGGADGLCAV